MARLTEAQLRQQQNRDTSGRYKELPLTGGIPDAPAGCDDPFLHPNPPLGQSPEQAYKVPERAGDDYARYNGEAARYGACSGINPYLLAVVPGVTAEGEAPVMVGWTDEGPHAESYFYGGVYHGGPEVEDVYLVAPVHAAADGTVVVPLPGAERWGTIPGVGATDGSTNMVRARAYPNGVMQWLGPNGEYLDDPGAVIAETIGAVKDENLHNFPMDDNCVPEVRFTPVRPQDRTPGGPVGALSIAWFTREN